MFQLNVHAIPVEESENFEKFAGAYITVYLNYLDPDGAYELARYYVTEEGWEIKEIEEEYFVINSEAEVEEDQLEFYRQAMETGYSIIFHCYETEDET